MFIVHHSSSSFLILPLNSSLRTLFCLIQFTTSTESPHHPPQERVPSHATAQAAQGEIRTKALNSTMLHGSLLGILTNATWKVIRRVVVTQTPRGLKVLCFMFPMISLRLVSQLVSTVAFSHGCRFACRIRDSGDVSSP